MEHKAAHVTPIVPLDEANGYHHVGQQGLKDGIAILFSFSFRLYFHFVCVCIVCVFCVVLFCVFLSFRLICVCLCFVAYSSVMCFLNG